MAIEGIITDGDEIIGRYRADENAITFSGVSDPSILAKLKDGLRREWPVVVSNERRNGLLSEVYERKRPSGLSTIAHFNEMIVSLGYTLDDPVEVP